MINPLENPDGVFHVLINEEGQYSLWPAFINVPAGWDVIRRESTRKECLDYINENWTDMRPKSLIKAMEANSATETTPKKKKKTTTGPQNHSNGVVN